MLEQLKKEIAEKQRELARLEALAKVDAKSAAIKSLDEFTVEDKVAIFDQLYASAMSVIEEKEQHGYVNEDTPHYLYEGMMGILARNNKEFWKYFNNIGR